MEFALTEREKRILIDTARAAIEARLTRNPPRFPEPTPALQAPCGAFVTLKAGGSLRGCIGHIAATEPLVDTVKEVAVSSAFEDPRFPPLRREEWGGIRVEISVLSPFERITDPARVVVGVHGLMVKRGYRSGLLLPQVATEQGWDRETFLAHACRKAGLPPDAWRLPDTQLEIFSALVFHEDA
jgi:AmmeMemoRadiSam system protein A